VQEEIVETMFHLLDFEFCMLQAPETAPDTSRLALKLGGTKPQKRHQPAIGFFKAVI